VKDRAHKVLVTTNKQMQAEIDDKVYKENKKRDALQRVQYEIDQ
jgi:hypothetical protein